MSYSTSTSKKHKKLPHKKSLRRSNERNLLDSSKFATLGDLDARLNKNPRYREYVRKNGFIDDLGTLLLKSRIAQGISQAELARRMKTQQPSIARVEGGFVRPTVDFLARMATALNIRIIVTSEPLQTAKRKKILV